MQHTSVPLGSCPCLSASRLWSLVEDTDGSIDRSPNATSDPKARCWKASSRTCQAYTWLGSVNIKAAGTSTKSADKLTVEETYANYAEVDIAKVDRNIEIAAERLEVLKFVRGKGERERVKAEAERSATELRLLHRQERVDLVESARKLRVEVVRMKEQTEKDLIVAKTLDFQGVMLANLEKMNEMTREQNA